MLQTKEDDGEKEKPKESKGTKEIDDPLVQEGKAKIKDLKEKLDLASGVVLDTRPKSEEEEKAEAEKNLDNLTNSADREANKKKLAI